MTSSHQVDVLDSNDDDNTTSDFPRFFTSPLEGPFPLFSRCRDSYTPELTRAFPRYSIAEGVPTEHERVSGYGVQPVPIMKCVGAA
jgi:hypothetical protein